MSKCVFAGTFDPFTKGHLDVVNRLAKTFDTVFVV
ncbi:MAG: adenylyltransferase/cytidyltransferase family protein, partial [Clostridia bacterium]|nr:adenylyltransferase/cytidyltransferase family protein [Clostridia bacterium]